MSALLLLLLPAALVAPAEAAPVDGRVRERGTGDPIEGAWVRTEVVEARTGADGRFHLDLPEGDWVLSVGSPEHIPQALSLRSPQELPLEVFLVPDEGPLEIIVEARRPSPHASRQVLDRERVLQTPGTHTDPMRLIQALPGVALTREYSPAGGDLAIRGSAPVESRITLDNVEIPYLYHFQQYSSVVHTRLLDEVAVYPSAYGAAYGNTTGAMVAVSTLRPDARKVHGGANLNFIMGGGYLTAPVGEHTAVAASGRRSYLDAVEDGNDQYTLWPIFWDYLGQVEHELGAQGRVRLLSLGAGDRYGRYAGDTALLDPLQQEDNPSFDYDRAFHTLIAEADLRQGQWRSLTTLGAVTDARTGAVPGAVPGASESRGERSLVLRQELRQATEGWWGLSTGLDARASWVDRQAETDRSWPELSREAPMLGRGEDVDHQQGRVTIEPWLEPRLDLRGTRVNLGLRGLVDTATTRATLDPRLTVQRELATDLHLRAAAGRYSQAPPLDLLGPDGIPDLGLASSEQASLGLDQAFAGRWEVSLDLWAKRVHDTWSTEADGTPVVVDGQAAGIELATRYRLKERFFSWASLTLGRATRDGRTFEYDQPVAINLVASWETGKGWTLGTRYRWGTGLPYTPVIGGSYQGDSDAYEAVLGEPYSARLPAYSKLDLQVDKSWTFERWKLGAYLALWWVPPSANVLYPAYSFDYGEEVYVRGPALLPLLGGHVDF